MGSRLARGTSHMWDKPSSACGCVRWFFPGYSGFRPTYRLIRLDMSEKAWKGRKTESKKKKKKKKKKQVSFTLKNYSRASHQVFSCKNNQQLKKSCFSLGLIPALSPIARMLKDSPTYLSRSRCAAVIQILIYLQNTIATLTLAKKKHIWKIIKQLQQRNVHVEIDWTPGHSSIAGNEVADKLAKEAAEEASKFPEEKRIISQPEIKLASNQYITAQWQKRWEYSDTGRDFFSYIPSVNYKSLWPNR